MVRGSPLSSLRTLEPTCDALMHSHTAVTGQPIIGCTETVDVKLPFCCMMVSLYAESHLKKSSVM